MPDVFKVKNIEKSPHDKKHSNYLHCMLKIDKKDEGLL